MGTVDTVPFGLPLAVERLLERVYNLLDAQDPIDAHQAAIRLREEASAIRQEHSIELHRALDRWTDAKRARSDDDACLNEEELAAKDARKRNLQLANARRFAVAQLKREISEAGSALYPTDTPVSRRMRQLAMVLDCLYIEEDREWKAIRARVLLGQINHLKEVDVKRMLTMEGASVDARLDRLTQRQRWALADRLNDLVPLIGTNRASEHEHKEKAYA